jgi:cytidyltransferase-like protein
MQKIGLFPGSFDPFTKGHEAVVRKALGLFDELIIAIGLNSSKSSHFDLEKRKAHIESLFNGEKLRIVTYQQLTVDLCREIGATHIVRGLRDSKDFGYDTFRYSYRFLFDGSTICGYQRDDCERNPQKQWRYFGICNQCTPARLKSGIKSASLSP